MHWTLLFLFLLTGVTALGYQLVWTRMLANTLGHEMPAVVAVVTMFMAGMALGAWWLGRRISLSPYPGRWYAGLEMFIGLWAVLCAFFAPEAPIILLPAVMAMGASFPAIARLSQGRYIAALYASNTIGAVAGILATTWWLMPEFGLRKSALVLAGLNVCVGFIAWPLTGARVAGEPAVAGRRLLLTVWVTGFLAIGIEIAGLRVLAQVMENTIYSFASALAIYLLGTSLGAALYHRFGNERWLDDLLGATAVVSLGTIYVMAKAQSIYNALRSAFGDSVVGVMTAEMALAACVFLLPTVLLGSIFSALMHRQPAAFPRLLAVNTFGSAVAPFLIGVVLLPNAGSKWALVILSLAYFALLTRWRWLMPAVALGMVIMAPELRFVQAPAGGAILDYGEGVMASVAVVSDAAGDRTLKVNNRFQMGGTSAAATEYRQAHLPLLLHPNPQRALFLGAGTGITFGAANLYPKLQADGVELLPEVVEMMHYFEPHNFHNQYNGRLHIHVADARRFVNTTTRRYDVIVADLFHPARDGAGTLYTREHYAAVRGRLADGGMFCQWLPLHQMDEEMLRVITQTFLAVFPETRAYLLHWNVDIPVLGLFGAGVWPTHTNGWVEARAQSEPLQTHLKRLAMTDSTRVFGTFVAGPKALQTFAGTAPTNTDDHQIVTYAAPRFSYQRNATSYGRLLRVLELEAPPNDFIRARNVYLRGLVDETEGRMDQAMDRYLESARISRDFTSGYARCLTLASLLATDRPERARALLQRLAEAQPDQKLARDILERLFPAPQN